MNRNRHFYLVIVFALHAGVYGALAVVNLVRARWGVAGVDTAAAGVLVAGGWWLWERGKRPARDDPGKGLGGRETRQRIRKTPKA